VIARWQLLELGFSVAAIRHRLETGRLHQVYPGVYAVGRPELTQHGRWMAGTLRCGPEAVLSHESAAALWGIRPEARRGSGSAPEIHVSLPAAVFRRPRGIRTHRRTNLTAADVTTRYRIPTTAPICTLIDLAAKVSDDHLEAAINAADKLDLVDPETLRDALAGTPPRPGLTALRSILDRHTFRRTDSGLERRLLKLRREAGLPTPLTQQWVNGYRVDFHWPDLGLVVETDSLRYHRTAAQQAVDQWRDQAHAAAGLERLRFSRAQVRYQPTYVVEMLERVIRRLTSRRASD
jgi:very-short-patch-repair endonuclease